MSFVHLDKKLTAISLNDRLRSAGQYRRRPFSIPVIRHGAGVHHQHWSAFAIIPLLLVSSSCSYSLIIGGQIQSVGSRCADLACLRNRDLEPTPGHSFADVPSPDLLPTLISPIPGILCLLEMIPIASPMIVFHYLLASGV